MACRWLPRWRAVARYVAVVKGTSTFWQIACSITDETMAFMISMIFAFTLIAVTTVVTTLFAVLLVRWMLQLGGFLWLVRASANAFLEVEGQASRAILQR